MSERWREFNMNDVVRVKLTHLGMGRLKEIHDKYSREEFNLRLADDGSYETQLWCLMRDFGDIINIGCTLPFGAGIQFKESDLS